MIGEKPQEWKLEVHWGLRVIPLSEFPSDEIDTPWNLLTREQVEQYSVVDESLQKRRLAASLFGVRRSVPYLLLWQGELPERMGKEWEFCELLLKTGTIERAAVWLSEHGVLCPPEWMASHMPEAINLVAKAQLQ